MGVLTIVSVKVIAVRIREHVGVRVRVRVRVRARVKAGIGVRVAALDSACSHKMVPRSAQHRPNMRLSTTKMAPNRPG